MAELGRPTKLTRKLSDEICRLIRSGNYLETAAAAAGVHPVTVRRWLKKGARAKKGVHHDFCIAYKTAEAQGEAAAVVRIRRASDQHWQAEAWWLERRFPSKWGRWQRPEEPDAHEEASAEYVVSVRRKHFAGSSSSSEGDE